MSLNPFGFLFETKAYPHGRTLRTGFWRKLKDTWTVIDGENRPQDTLRLLGGFARDYEQFKQDLNALTRQDESYFGWRSFFGSLRLYSILLMNLCRTMIQNTRLGLFDYLTFRLPSVTTLLLLPLIGVMAGLYFLWDQAVGRILSVTNPWWRLGLSVSIALLLFPTVIIDSLATLAVTGVALGVGYCVRKATEGALMVLCLPIVALVQAIAGWIARPAKDKIYNLRVRSGDTIGTVADYLDAHHLSLDDIVLEKKGWKYFIAPKKEASFSSTLMLFSMLTDSEGRETLQHKAVSCLDFDVDCSEECQIDVSNAEIELFDRLNVPGMR